jgi:hypothetical protein
MNLCKNKGNNKCVQILSCKNKYLLKGNNKIVLLAMAQGLKPEGIANTNLEPFKSAKHRRLFVPLAKDIKKCLMKNLLSGLRRINYTKSFRC